MTYTIYHNPDCGTSRNVLALLERAGCAPKVVRHLETPPDRKIVLDLVRRAGMSLRDTLRRKGAPYDDLGLDDPSLGDEAFLDAIGAHPILLNRPFVVAPKGVRLCRPSDIVLDLLPAPPKEDILKEEGAPFLLDEPVPPDEVLRAALAAEGLATADLDEPAGIYFRYRTLAGESVGWGGFLPLDGGKDVLVRSLVVEPPRRGRKIGRNILALLLRRAFDSGARRAFLLTTAAEGFFAKAGFRPLARESAPPALLATPQAAGLCPASAVLMMRRIVL